MSRRLAEWKFSAADTNAEYTDALVSRVKQLWESNLTQAEIAKALNDEGYNIKPLALARLRRRKGFYMSGNSIQQPDISELSSDSASEGEMSQLSEAQHEKTQHKKSDLEMRKQRRKSTVFHAPSDGKPTRYPSELTVAEARSVLGIDEASFKVIRETFGSICEQHDITKKSIAGPHKWERAKTLLIESTPLLRDAFDQNADDMGARKLSLDTLCMSITRSAHYKGMYVKVAGVKNALGANPQQIRELRQTFHDVLYEHGIVHKTGPLRNWPALKHEWAAKSPFIKNIIDHESKDEQGKQRAQLAEKFARDILKRLRDQLRQKAKAQNSPPIEQHSAHDDSQDEYPHADFNISEHYLETATSNHLPQSPTYTQPQLQIRRPPARAAKHAATPIVSLQPPLDAPSPITLPSTPISYTRMTRYTTNVAPIQPPAQSCAVYMRLHPASNFTLPNSIWITTVPAVTIDSVRAAAAVKFPGTICGLVEGVVKDGVGGELPLRVQDDQELTAYMSHLQGASPTFNVQLLQT